MLTLSIHKKTSRPSDPVKDIVATKGVSQRGLGVTLVRHEVAQNITMNQ